jgi:hypothetical protein
MAGDKSYYCEKCNKTMNEDQFYGSNNLEKYPEGKLKQCKKCITMHVDNWNPDTYLWILQECDVPYIPDEWNKLLANYGKDRSKVTGMTILGRYLSKMKLKQYREYRWEHTEFLQELANKKIEETMKRQGYDAMQITEAITKATFSIPEGELQEPEFAPVGGPEYPQEDYFAQQYEDTTVFDDDLTEEDRKYLLLKWGKTYKPEEWIKLEQLYEEMMGSYDIQTAGHIDTLKLVCKTSLKANQLLDIGDVDGAQKMIKMYDGLMKSGKFTAAQNKAESGEYVDSISELVAICEKDGFIPRYYTDGPQDKVDRTLQDLQSYTHTLVTEEMNLGNLIENAVKQIEADRIKEAEDESEAADDDDLMEMSLFSDDAEKVLSDGDFEDFKDMEEGLSESDEDYIERLISGEGNK